MENGSCSIEKCMFDCRVTLPPGSVAVGRIVKFTNGVFCEVDFYVHRSDEGIDESLRTFGRIDSLLGQTGPETKVSVSRGPSENFYG